MLPLKSFLQFSFTETHSELLLDTFKWLPMGGADAAYHSCKGISTYIVFKCLMDIPVHCEIVGGGGGGGASTNPPPPPPTPIATPLPSVQRNTSSYVYNQNVS